MKNTVSNTGKDKVLIFTATYNEADNIPSLVKSIFSYLPQENLLVIDDNSPDGTGQILDQLQTGFPNLIVQHRQGKLGLGSAHKMAMRYALENNFDFLITMDADFSHDPKCLPQIVAMLGNYDFVIGSRFMPGGHCDYGPGRMVISRGANILARLLLGIKLRETTTSYRGFSRKLLQDLNIDRIQSDGYSFFFEQVYRISQLTTAVAEFPIHFADRRAGVSKISKKEIAKGITTLFRLAFDRLLGS